jgi:flagellar protein FlaI
MGGRAGWRIERPTGEAEVYALPDAYSLTAEGAALYSDLVSAHLERAGTANDRPLREQLKLLLQELCEHRGVLPSRASAERVLESAEKHLKGFGVLDPLLRDDELEEIAVTGVGEPVRVYHRQRGWLVTDAVLDGESYALHLINKMARPLGRRVTYHQPRLNATLPDGARLHASIAPLAAKGVELTVRKFTPQPYSPAELVANRTMSARCAALLWLTLEGDHSLLVAGNTGSGKTTTLNALFAFVPLAERVVVTEETPEIRIPHPHLVRLVASEELGISLLDLARDTLRMRPDRVILGEARTREETAALFDSLLAGQARGTYATFHGASAREALLRLQSLGVRREDLSALGLVIIQRRLSLPARGQRKALEIRRVVELAEVTPGGEARSLFARDPRRDVLCEVGLRRSETLERLADAHRCSPRHLLEELSARERWLTRAAEQKPLPPLSRFAEQAQSGRAG